jgi:transcriptional antiterminator NusG
MSSEEQTSETEEDNTGDSQHQNEGEGGSNGDQKSDPDIALLQAAQEEPSAPPVVGFDPFAAGSDDEKKEEAKDEPEESVEAAPAAVEEVSVEAVVESAADEVKEEAVPVPEVPEKEPHPDLRWYVVNAYSSYELKAKRALEERIRQHDLDDLFGEVHVPQETVVELVRGEKKTSNRKFFPGYMLVQMVLNQDTWHLVKETPKISGFVGDASEPVPLSEEEVGKILQQVEDGAASPRARVSFEQGDTVKVIDGPFTDFNGTIEEVKPEKGKVKVLISIFGRATPVELDFIQVEKS